MSKGNEIRCYDYVNHPYEQVCDVLKREALVVFQAATKAAASRAELVAAELHVDFGGVGIKADIRILAEGCGRKTRRGLGHVSNAIASGMGSRTQTAFVSADER